MKSVVVASVREGAGKTSLLVGILKAAGDAYGYMKPFGDRLIQKRKKNRDYDSSLLVDLFSVAEQAEEITLGFDHSKLRYIYDEQSVRDAVQKMVEVVGKSRKGVFIEAGKDLFYGASVRLDPFSLARHTNSSLVLVVSGEHESVIDDLTFIKKNMNTDDLSGISVIVNKVQDPDEFEELYAGEIQSLGYDLLGIVPFSEDLSFFTVKYLADRLYAKVVAGEEGLNNIIKNIFVGAASTGETMRNPLFNKENKFVITSGDRDDMILAALESNATGILLTNNVLPPTNIITLANEKNIPMLLVSADTFAASRRIGKLETLLTSDNTQMVGLLSNMAEKYLDIDRLFE